MFGWKGSWHCGKHRAWPLKSDTWEALDIFLGIQEVLCVWDEWNTISRLPVRKCSRPGFRLFLSSPHPCSEPALQALRPWLARYVEGRGP